MSEQEFSSESIRQAVSESVARGEDIRARVRELTLGALRDRRLDTAAMREVMSAVTEGIGLGAEQRAHDVKGALKEAVGGLDEALGKSAEATKLALQQLISQSREFSQTDLRPALDDLKGLEGEFVAALGRAADAAGAKSREAFRELVLHMQRAGTDTGAKVAETLTALSNRMSANMVEGTVAGMHAAQEFSLRLAALASGILAGMADALHDKARGK
jgi:hypothetical protein